jgi:hypothetical protein
MVLPLSSICQVAGLACAIAGTAILKSIAMINFFISLSLNING